MILQGQRIIATKDIEQYTKQYRGEGMREIFDRGISESLGPEKDEIIKKGSKGFIIKEAGVTSPLNEIFIAVIILWDNAKYSQDLWYRYPSEYFRILDAPIIDALLLHRLNDNITKLIEILKLYPTGITD